MRQADGTGRLPRVLSIVVLAILVLLVGSVGHAILTITTEPSIEERAHNEAVRRAALIGDALVHGSADGVAELGQTTARSNRSTCYGRRRHRRDSPVCGGLPGARHDVPTRDGRPVSTEVRVCFRQVLDQERADFSRTQVPCPDTLLPDATPTAEPAAATPPPPTTPGSPPTIPGAPPVSTSAPAR